MSWGCDSFRLGIFPELSEKRCTEKTELEHCILTGLDVRYRTAKRAKRKSRFNAFSLSGRMFYGSFVL